MHLPKRRRVLHIAQHSLTHRTDWLNAQPGVEPNFDFVRELRAALSRDDGTIFRWATHENSVLNRIRIQLQESAQPPSDRHDLVAFIESITERRGAGKEKVVGPRSMVDLCALAERFFFHPSTKGSSSLKKVLPALMRSSTFLRETYSVPFYGGAGVSRNFERGVAWWQERGGQVLDPYQLLPPVFDDVSAVEVKALEDGLSDELREGGAAMAAYARLQFEDMPDAQRRAIEAALLRYCELDTLAMVALDGGRRLRLDDKVDFWPATGAWRAVGPGANGQAAASGTGATSMLEFLKAERERSGQPVVPPAPLKTERSVRCKYCEGPAELHDGLAVYPNRKDLADRQFWVCWGCNAWVGCHRDSDWPFGDLADEQLRDARIAAHAAFDPVWKEEKLSRTAAYEWLASALDIPRQQCHIGLLEIDACRRVGQLVFERFGVVKDER